MQSLSAISSIIRAAAVSVALLGCAGAPVVTASRVDPRIQLASLSGKPATFPAVARGKLVVLDLWASWCEACRHELPRLQRLAAAARGSDLMVVAINVGEARAVAARYARELSLSLPIYLDPELRFAESVGARQFPAVLVLDRDGSIVLRARAIDDTVLRELRKRASRREAGR